MNYGTMMLDSDPTVIESLLRESIDSGRQLYLTVISNSMAPILRARDQIRLAPADVKQLQAGDVIVVSGRTELVTHRFWGYVKIGDEVNLVTRGDRSLQFDALIPTTELVAKVVARRRKNHLLRLSSGPGYWLNHQLAAMVAFEIRFFEDISLPVTEINQLPEEDKAGNISDQYGLSKRIIRRVLYSCGSLLTTLVGYITRFQKRVE